MAIYWRFWKTVFVVLKEFKKCSGTISHQMPILLQSFLQSIIVADVARGQRSRQAGVKREVKALSTGCVPDVFPLHDIAGCGSAARDVTAAPTPVIGSTPRAKGKVHPFYTGFSGRARACVCVLAHTHSHSPCTLLGWIFTTLTLGGEWRKSAEMTWSNIFKIFCLSAICKWHGALGISMWD